MATSAQQATDMAGWQAELPTIENDIATDNYLGAIKAAETTDNSATTDKSATENPLLQMLETSQGLQELDPSKQWSETDTAAYYKAFTDPSVYNANLLGQNPYGDWGDPTKSAQDAATNYKDDPNAAPNVVQFAGARPDKSFLSKYGADIAALAATVVTMGAASPLLAAAVGAGTLMAGNAAEGNATTWKSAGEDIAAGAIGAAVPGIDSALGGGALVDAGVGAAAGAAKGEITGGNVEADAIGGGVAGAVQGSGVGGAIKGDLGNVLGSQTAGNLLGGAATGLATSALTGLATNTLTSSSGKGAAASGSIAGSLGDVSGSSTSTATSKGTTTTLSPGVTPISNPATTPTTFTAPAATSASRGGQVFTDNPTPTTGWGSSFSVGG